MKTRINDAFQETTTISPGQNIVGDLGEIYSTTGKGKKYKKGSGPANLSKRNGELGLVRAMSHSKAIDSKKQTNNHNGMPRTMSAPPATGPNNQKNINNINGVPISHQKRRSSQEYDIGDMVMLAPSTQKCIANIHADTIYTPPFRLSPSTAKTINNNCGKDMYDPELAKKENVLKQHGEFQFPSDSMILQLPSDLELDLEHKGGEDRGGQSCKGDNEEFEDVCDDVYLLRHAPLEKHEREEREPKSNGATGSLPNGHTRAVTKEPCILPDGNAVFNT